MIPEFLDIPIFPLPNVTFFPQTILPLHIFEQRYRAMTSSCLAGDRLLGVALLREGWQKDYFGHPVIFKTFGVGKIVDHELLNDGRYNIVVQGLHRVKLVEEHENSPFRVGRVAVLRDERIDHLRAEVTQVQKDLSEACRRLAHAIPKLRSTIQSCWSAHPHPGVIADLVASALVIDPYDRQSILEETDPLRRMKLALVQIRCILQQLSQSDAIEEEVLEEE
ncbi:LON peptidase substrate-binding domain-containing protein [Candidatus Sumerlaeota bacterium]|nr:LON peptidase substrate-binding domain-containing protein [Candidatus Sumerlaeota bacterium]